MPSHPDRVRSASLPAGYQFGDGHAHDLRARWMLASDEYHAVCVVCGHDAGPVAIPSGWNVIEGEHFDSDADQHRTVEGAPVSRSLGVRILDA